MTLTDDSGNFQLALCASLLFVQHGLRDFLITALPRFTLETDEAITTILPSSASTYGIEDNKTLTSTVLETYHPINSQIYLIKDGWTSGNVGLALSIIHWTWIVPLILSPLYVPRVAKIWLFVFASASSGIVALFSALAAVHGGPLGLIILRAVQGLCQGCSYPTVYFILQNVQCSTFALAYFVVFLAPWLGSSLGLLMGGTDVPFLGSYFFGALSLLLAAVSYLVPLSSDNPSELSHHAWKETMTSLPVWACVLVQTGGVWALHSFAVGMSFTLDYKLAKAELYWTVFIVVLIGGVTTRLMAQGAMGLMRNHFLSALNRRRVVITSGNFIILLTLITNGLVSVNSEWSLFGVSLCGVCFGTSLCFVGDRLNLHDLGPAFPGPFLLLGAVGASVGAGCASLLFPIIAQIDRNAEDVEVEDKSFLAAWLTPVAVVVVASLVHNLLLSVSPLQHQTLAYKDPTETNGAVLSSQHIPVIRRESDKSFISIRSALTFRTAVSRTRSRTVSFKTVDEDFEADLRTIAESEDCRTALPDDDDNVDLKSIKSAATSFKSTGEEQNETGRKSGVILSAEELDRTSVWLSTRQNTSSEVAMQIAEEKKKIEKNVLLALQW